MNSFYTEEELEDFDFLKMGQNVKISRKASIYSPEKMSFSDNVRIDDFCILSGHIELENNIHIAAFSALYGSCKIHMGSFSAISAAGKIYSSSDDYSGNYLSNPTVPEKFRHLNSQEVNIGKHAIIGANCVLLPGGSLGEGTSVGAMSLIDKPLPAWTICVGIPARAVRKRSNQLLELEKVYLATK